MTVTRSLAISTILLATGCVSSQPKTQAPRPARSELGPAVSIDVTYTGGVIAREVTALFSVRENAFVVVGHLGGDGVLRILYPVAPTQFHVTQAGRRYKTPAFFAGYDGAPSLYSFSLSPYRSLGARFDSYDGRGYGYVFVIATRIPLRYDAFNDGYDWVDLDVRDYFKTSDPRLAIREFAERITRGNYTLRFAKSYTTQNFSGYAAQAFDCSVLSSIGHRYFNGFFDSWGRFGYLSPHNVFPYSDNYNHGCGPRHYASYNYRSYAWGNAYIPYTPNTAPPTTSDPVTRTLTRPTERAFGQRAGNAVKSELERSNSRNARSVYASARARYNDYPRESGTSNRDRGSYDPPSAWSARDAGSSARQASGGGGSVNSTPPPAPQPAPTTAVPGSQGATTKVKQ